MRQTTQDGLTVDEIETAYEVLEVVRENLSDDGMESMSETVNEAHYLVQLYEERARWDTNFDLPDVGDILVDPESPSRFGDGRVEVVEVLDGTPSKLHYVDVPTGKRSVARLNPEHPSDAPVVIGRYVDGSKKRYAFPCTRLED